MRAPLSLDWPMPVKDPIRRQRRPPGRGGRSIGQTATGEDADGTASAAGLVNAYLQVGHDDEGM